MRFANSFIILPFVASALADDFIVVLEPDANIGDFVEKIDNIEDGDVNVKVVDTYPPFNMVAVETDDLGAAMLRDLEGVVYLETAQPYTIDLPEDTPKPTPVSVTEPISEPTIEPEPILESQSDLIPEPTLEPSSGPVPESTSEPIPEPSPASSFALSSDGIPEPSPIPGLTDSSDYVLEPGLTSSFESSFEPTSEQSPEPSPQFPTVDDRFPIPERY